MNRISIDRDCFRAMNTDIEVKLASRNKDIDKQLFHDIRNWFSLVESRFSRFQPNSELSRLNASRGFPIRISAMMMEILSHAGEYRRLTSRIYEPGILHSLEHAGYCVSFENMASSDAAHTGPRNFPNPKPPSAAYDNNAPGWTVYPYFRLARLSRGISLDLGGLVKGWAVDRIADRLIAEGIPSGQINAGGDLRVWGQEDWPSWEVDVASPWFSSGINDIPSLATAVMKKGAAATSGTIRRSWHTSEGRKHHLIDPRSGTPSDSDVIQCTVLGASAADAEVAAKTVCILGSRTGASWMEEAFPGYDALIVKKEGAIHFIRGIPSAIQWKGEIANG